MQEEVRVVLDAMGGDHAPEEMIKGAVEAVNEKITSMFFWSDRKMSYPRNWKNIPILRKEWRLSMHPK